jgi:hypothetical protein
LAASIAQAQQRPVVRCEGQPISNITVHTAAPTAAVLRRVRLLGAIVAAVHQTTEPEVIRRFLLFSVGDRCNELRRAESERILRAQPFIAEASVLVYPDSSGAVELDVRTTDEVALVVGGAIGRGSPPIRFFRLGDANLGGQGVYAAADWRDGGQFRNGYGGRLIDNQLFGQPYTFTASGHQNPLGSDWEVDLSHAFYTDVQRIAWRAQSGAIDDYVQYRNDENSSHAIRVGRNYFDVGGIIRLGPPGRLSLFGASISGDDERPGAVPVLITKDGFAPDPGSQLANRFVDHRIARVNALWGVRDIGFARVTGFDALTATQDLPVGFQLGTLFGRSLSVLGSRDDDIFMAGDLYVGAVGRNNGLRLQLEGEGRRSNDDEGRWDGILANGRAVEYLQWIPITTTTISVEYSGGWRQRIPFNLSLSDPDGGVRGYASSNTPGGQRAVARIENHVYGGWHPFEQTDFGFGVFADAGRLWAGDIPYGVSTPFRSSAGISLLGAAPRGSARIWRVDVVYAINPEAGGHRFELRFSNTNKTTFFLTEPSDIQATREHTVPSSVFRWPK